MIKITITTCKVDASLIEEHPQLAGFDKAYYVIRESGKRISEFYADEDDAVCFAWKLILKYGFSLVEPW